MWAANLVVVAAVASFVAVGAGSLVGAALAEPGSVSEGAPAHARGAGETGRSASEEATRRSSALICRRNVFDFEVRPCVVEESPEPADEPEEEPWPPTLCPAGARLVGTVTSSEPAWSFAMVRENGKATPYRSGDETPGLGDVEQVGWRLVLVDQGDGGPA